VEQFDEPEEEIDAAFQRRPQLCRLSPLVEVVSKKGKKKFRPTEFLGSAA